LTQKKVYFISDVHLGLYPYENSREREKKLVRFLDSIKSDAGELYLVGDIFDFWHEHKHVIPKGFVRFFGKLAELVDLGIQIHFFTGNHDIWAYGYFTEELGIPIYKNPVEREFNGKKFFIGHGDGLGPGDKGYKILKAFFTSKFLQWWFARLHPNFSMWLGKTWSKKSRYSKGIIAEEFSGAEGEFQIMYAASAVKKKHFDYFIFGHRHIPYIYTINSKSQVVNLGDWIYSFTYAVFDGQDLKLNQFEGDGKDIIRN
jgi:UDP-2,3-diacylglucosamine hydrolase